jgi:hypothetical protein
MEKITLTEHDKQIRKATDIHTELMDLCYKMYMTEEADFNRVIQLLRDSYSNQLVLINTLKEKEEENVQITQS